VNQTIVLDGTPLSAPHTGIARYTAELMAALTKLKLNFDFMAIRPPAKPGLIEGRWWSIGLPRRLREMKAVLFHGTDFAVPLLGRTPSVVTVHDLSPLRTSEWQMPATAVRVARRLPGAIRRARAVIAPSARVKEEIATRFRISRDQIFVTPLAASRVFFSGPGAHALACDRRYLLYVGSAQRRKNLPRLLAAFAMIRKKHDLGLMIVGGDPSMALELRVRRLAAVSDAHLARLYADAAAVIYPSLYEGFGLPVIEAMASGAPVVTSRDTASADVAGGAAILVDPEKEEDIAEAVLAILEKPGLAADLRRKGRARAAEFSWQLTAQRTWEAYEGALSRS
jgi:glycosyltransferase involved in cell wall biosynthesis